MLKGSWKTRCLMWSAIEQASFDDVRSVARANCHTSLANVSRNEQTSLQSGRAILAAGTTRHSRGLRIACSRVFGHAAGWSDGGRCRRWAEVRLCEVSLAAVRDKA